MLLREEMGRETKTGWAGGIGDFSEDLIVKLEPEWGEPQFPFNEMQNYLNILNDLRFGWAWGLSPVYPFGQVLISRR